MDVMLFLCLLAALAGAGYGWYSMARKDAEDIRKRIAEGQLKA